MEYTNMRKDELKSNVTEAPHDLKPKEQQTSTQPHFIKGIHELARFLGVCPARAQKLKNEKIIPCFQDGRLVLFDIDEVKEAMKNYNKIGGKGYGSKR